MHYKPCTCQVVVSAISLQDMRVLVLMVVYLAKVLGGLSRLFRLGRGTSISGWIVEKRLPFLLAYFKSKYKKVIYISGTNGKTTTRSLIVQALRDSSKQVVTNSGGANIYRGLAASLLNDVDFFGNIRSEFAVLEVEEATLPILCSFLPAQVIVLTNLARDQLDVYGELDITQGYFINSLSKCLEAKVIINSDDPKLLEINLTASIGVTLRNSTIQYEVARQKKAQVYRLLIIEQEGTELAITYNTEHSTFTPQLTGQYNSINYALAAATLIESGLSLTQITSSFKVSKPVFGRSESILTKSAKHSLILVKNPLGLSSVLANRTDPITRLIIGINDNIADGKDVSWLWDVDFEGFLENQVVSEIIVTGQRSGDVGLRIQQALRHVNKINKILSYSQAEVVALLLSTPNDYMVLGTYTVMMQLRSKLEKQLNLPTIDSNNF